VAVKIRLLRIGRKKRPFYRVVAIDSRTRRDGRYLEKLGYYDPLTKPATVKLEKEKILAWLEKGAIPSETVFNLLQKEGIALEWHLIKNKFDAQAANIELQKWAMLRKMPVTKLENTLLEPEKEVVLEEETEAPAEEVKPSGEEKPVEESPGESTETN